VGYSDTRFFSFFKISSRTTDRPTNRDDTHVHDDTRLTAPTDTPICRYEGHRLQQLGLEQAATGLMLDACRATSLCNAYECNGIDDLTYGGQGEDDIQNWRALYLRPQWKQESNPKFAAMCDNWDLASAYKPQIKAEAQSVYNQVSAACAYKVTEDWSPEVPYARVCIPTHVGRKRGIPENSYIYRINPYGSPATDYTSQTFYKGGY